MINKAKFIDKFCFEIILSILYYRLDHHFHEEAFYQNNLEQAESYYKKALKLNKSIHEIYFGLAKVYYRMDKKPLAKKMMRKAIKFNDLDSTNNMYVAKFNFLNSEQIH